MDQLVDTPDDTSRKTGAEGFAALWSDMPRDVIESVRLHDRAAPGQARLTMQAPTARVEIHIAPRAKGETAETSQPAARGPHDAKAACAAASKTQEKDQNP